MSVTKVQLVGNVSTGASFAGIITATSAIIGTGVTINASGISLTGVVTATSLSVGTGVTINASGISLTGVVTATSLSVGGRAVSSLGVGINTAGGSVGTGATVIDFRGAGISTVTVASGIATVNITGGGGGASVSTSDTAPSSPADGDLWYDSIGGRTYVYYQDANTSQWVDAAPQGGGPAYAAKIEVGNTKAEITDTGSDGAFAVTTEGTERIRVTPQGELLVGTATRVASAGVLQVSNGITFPATAVAVTDANTLDDYEEGSWSPSVGGNATYNTQSGRYTKIGNVCTIVLEMHINVLGTGSLNTISGAPFTANSALGSASAAVGYASNLATNIIALTFRLDYGSTTISNAILTTAANTVTNSASIYGNNARVLFSLTYLTV